MHEHDSLCRYELGLFGPVESCDCTLIKEVRADERVQLEKIAANVTIIRHIDDPVLTLDINDPQAINWTPVSLSLIKELVGVLNDLTQQARHDEREKIAVALAEMRTDEYNGLSINQDEAVAIARNGGSNE